MNAAAVTQPADKYGSPSPAARPKALVLAAGEGSRLRPLTLTMPKPMLPIGGEPLLEHTLHWLHSHGIYDIAINLHYRGDVVMSHFGDGSQLGINLTYSPEQNILGTAGAVRKLASYFEGSALIIYGDLLTNVNLDRLLAFHSEKTHAAGVPAITMSLYKPLNPRECGVVVLDDDSRIRGIVEKPTGPLPGTLAFSGVMILDCALIDRIPPDRAYDFGFQFLPQVIQDNVPVFGLPIEDPEYVIDIGTPERYRHACEQWELKQARMSS